MDYKTSGVDVEAGRNFVNQIRSSVESTFRKEVIGGLGGFGGCIKIPKGFQNPVLVAGTDGVGTKLELAQAANSHFGLGIDLVAMCVNDVITNGAEPLFFLDYMATGALSSDALAKVVDGIAKGCKISGCALLGGETAEMPGFYQKSRYDLAGFCVAVVEESDLVDGSLIREGDQILGLASSGLHSNGFSLVRKILSSSGIDIERSFGQDQLSLIDTILAPTTIYAPVVKALFKNKLSVHGMAHITGGGLPENLPRFLPQGLKALIDPTSWEIPEIFNWLKNQGEIPEQDFWNTFNLGIGFCLVLSKDSVKSVSNICKQLGFVSWTIGSVEKSESDQGNEILGLPFE